LEVREPELGMEGMAKVVLSPQTRLVVGVEADMVRV
jgi:hypothetical protein